MSKYLLLTVSLIALVFIVLPDQTLAEEPGLVFGCINTEAIDADVTDVDLVKVPPKIEFMKLVNGKGSENHLFSEP